MSYRVLFRLTRRVTGLLFPFKISRQENHALEPPFPGFHWFTTFLTLLMLAIIVPLNYALQGYQVESSYSPDYYTTSPHWYNVFYPAPKPGSQCEKHTFNIGDSITTTVGIFNWAIANGNTRQAIAEGKAGLGSWNLSYAGQSLDWCDISEMQISVNAAVQSGLLSWLMECYWSNSSFLAIANLDIANPDDGAISIRGFRSDYQWAQQYVVDAAWDLIHQMQNLIQDNSSSPIQLSFVALWPAQCPAVLHSDDYQASMQAYATLKNDWDDRNDWCNPSDPASLTNPPSLALDWSTATLMTKPRAGPEYRPLISNAINNVFQAMLAAGRADLGNILPNNFLNNTITVLEQSPPIFLPPFPQAASDSTLLFNESLFYTDNKETNWLNGWLTYQNYGMLQHELALMYYCHLTRPKSAGSAFVSVFAATVTMGAAAWKVYTWIANLIVSKLNSSSDDASGDKIEGSRDEESALGGQDFSPRKYFVGFPMNEGDEAIPLNERLSDGTNPNQLRP